MIINPIRFRKRTPTELRQRQFELAQMWPNNTWTTYAKKVRMDHDTRCDCCEEYATRVAITNVWGGVYELYVCAKHYNEVNNTWRDSIPEKKPIEDLVAYAGPSIRALRG